MAETKDKSPFEEILSKLWNTVEKLRKFWRTKRAIDQGIPLYDWLAADIVETRYFGPWAFNAFQVASTGAIAVAIINLVQFVTGVVLEEEKTGILFDPDDPKVIAMLGVTSGWFEPFVVPILTTALVFLIGWGSLKRKDSSSESRKRARSAYLYFDAAYGCLPQLFIAISASTLAIAARDDSDASKVSLFKGGLLMVFLIILIVGIIWQLYLSMSKIPKSLFAVNGYSRRVPHFWKKRLPSDGPWSKWSFATFIGGPPLLVGIKFLLGVLAYGLAICLVAFKGMFGSQ